MQSVALVGEDPARTILRYDGSSWSVHAAPTTTFLRGLSGTSSGDVWALGEHRVTCGDSRSVNLSSADVLLSDPPYGISIVEIRAVEAPKEHGAVRRGPEPKSHLIKGRIGFEA